MTGNDGYAFRLSLTETEDGNGDSDDDNDDNDSADLRDPDDEDGLRNNRDGTGNTGFGVDFMDDDEDDKAKAGQNQYSKPDYNSNFNLNSGAKNDSPRKEDSKKFADQSLDLKKIDETSMREDTNQNNNQSYNSGVADYKPNSSSRLSQKKPTPINLKDKIKEPTENSYNNYTNNQNDSFKDNQNSYNNYTNNQNDSYNNNQNSLKDNTSLNNQNSYNSNQKKEELVKPAALSPQRNDDLEF